MEGNREAKGLVKEHINDQGNGLTMGFICPLQNMKQKKDQDA